MDQFTRNEEFLLRHLISSIIPLDEKIIDFQDTAYNFIVRELKGNNLELNLYRQGILRFEYFNQSTPSLLMKDKAIHFIKIVADERAAIYFLLKRHIIYSLFQEKNQEALKFYGNEIFIND